MNIIPQLQEQIQVLERRCNQLEEIQRANFDNITELREQLGIALAPKPPLPGQASFASSPNQLAARDQPMRAY